VWPGSTQSTVTPYSRFTSFVDSLVHQGPVDYFRHRAQQRDMTNDTFFSMYKSKQSSASSNIFATSGHIFASYALAWSEMRCLHSSLLLDDMLYTSEIKENRFSVVGSRDGKATCDQRVNVEIMAGYLARRFQFGGEFSQ
jgi:hypothetical protein